MPRGPKCPTVQATIKKTTLPKNNTNQKVSKAHDTVPIGPNDRVLIRVTCADKSNKRITFARAMTLQQALSIGGEYSLGKTKLLKIQPLEYCTLEDMASGPIECTFTGNDWTKSTRSFTLQGYRSDPEAEERFLELPSMLREKQVVNVDIKVRRSAEEVYFAKGETMPTNICCNVSLDTNRKDEGMLVKRLRRLMRENKGGEGNVHTEFGELWFTSENTKNNDEFIIKVIAMRKPSDMHEFLCELILPMVPEPGFATFNTFLAIVNAKISRMVPKERHGQSMILKLLHSNGFGKSVSMGKVMRCSHKPTHLNGIDLECYEGEDDIPEGQTVVGISFGVRDWAPFLSKFQGAEVGDRGVLPGQSGGDDVVLYNSGALSFTFKFFDNARAKWNPEMEMRLILLANVFKAILGDIF
jgi:hypothetical protein